MALPFAELICLRLSREQKGFSQLGLVTEVRPTKLFIIIVIALGFAHATDSTFAITTSADMCKLSKLEFHYNLISMPRLRDASTQTDCTCTQAILTLSRAYKSQYIYSGAHKLMTSYGQGQGRPATHTQASYGYDRTNYSQHIRTSLEACNTPKSSLGRSPLPRKNENPASTQKVMQIP